MLMKSCGTFSEACAAYPGSADDGVVMWTVLTTSQSASVTPFGLTCEVAWKIHEAPPLSGVDLVHL